MRRKVLAVLCGVAASILATADVMALDPSPEGELSIQVIAADKPDYIREWVSSPYEHPVHIQGVREAIPNQTFYVAVIATGFGVHQQGTTDLSGDFTLRNPDGTLMFDEKDVFKHQKAMLHRTGFVMLDPAIDLTLEKDDQRGKYIFRAVVHDEVSGKIAFGEYEITLKD